MSAKNAFLMTGIKVLEPSVADVLKAIEQAPDLKASKKAHWSCSLRQICLGIGRPPESIAGRWSAVNSPIQQLHHARVGCNPKTLANHKANARAALLWFAGAKNLPKRGCVLSASWTSLRAKIPDEFRRDRLSGLVRYASTKGIEPRDVNEEVFDAHMRYRAETTALACDDAARRRIARAWNACVDNIPGWPQRRLIEPPVKTLTKIPWEAFPEGLRADIERYLAGFTKMRRGAIGKRIRPCKSSTIDTRRRELQAFARMAFEQGVPIEQLDSLSAILQPDLVEKILHAYWKQNGQEPSTFTIDMGWKILSVAREAKCLSEADLARLDDMRAALEEHRRKGLTDKNLTVVRQVLTEGVWDEVVKLPTAMMAKARLMRHHAPIKAAVTAQLAIAIAIFTFAPIRLGNLIRIMLEENLIRLGGIATHYWLVFPHYDVKNRMQLQFKLPPELSELIDEYINDYRPTLLRGSIDLWLFPGQKREIKNSRTLSLQVTDWVIKATGLRITVHQFRHAAAAIFLKHRPGEYELVRRMLGHRSIETTRNFYIGLENIQASEIFSNLIKERLNRSLEIAE
jgi:integrase